MDKDPLCVKIPPPKWDALEVPEEDDLLPFSNVMSWSSSKVSPLTSEPRAWLTKNPPFWPASRVALLPKMVIILPSKSIALEYGPI